MGAMRQVRISPQTAAWHSWRAQGIGGSDAPIIAADAGLCKPASWMKSIEDLWKIKTGLMADISEPNWGMKKGIRAEPLARAAFERETGILLSPICGEMIDSPFVRSSFDGVNLPRDFNCEIKYGSKYLHDLAKNHEVIDCYRPQLAHQGLTLWGHPDEWEAGTQLCFASFIPDTNDLAYVIKPAFEYRELADKLFEAEKKFWDRVQQRLEPVTEEWRQAAFRYIAAYEDKVRAEEELDAAKAELIKMAGDNDKKAGAGVSVTRQEKQGALDYSRALKELLPTVTPEELEVYRKAGSTSHTVRVLH